jgi:hypothetical protein
MSNATEGTRFGQRLIKSMTQAVEKIQRGEDLPMMQVQEPECVLATKRTAPPEPPSGMKTTPAKPETDIGTVPAKSGRKKVSV